METERNLEIGLGYSVYRQIITLARAMNCDQEVIDNLFIGKGEHHIEKMSAALSGVDLNPSIFEISIPSTNFNELISLGNYKRVDKKVIEENFIFPIKPYRGQKVHLEIVRYNNSTNSEDVDLEQKKLADKGFRGANHYELLTFAIQYPEFQNEYPILALNSNTRNSVMGKKGILYLKQTHGQKHLSIAWSYGPQNPKWIDYARQLIVRL